MHISLLSCRDAINHSARARVCTNEAFARGATGRRISRGVMFHAIATPLGRQRTLKHWVVRERDSREQNFLHFDCRCAYYCEQPLYQTNRTVKNRSKRRSRNTTTRRSEGSSPSRVFSRATARSVKQWLANGAVRRHPRGANAAATMQRYRNNERIVGRRRATKSPHYEPY